MQMHYNAVIKVKITQSQGIFIYQLHKMAESTILP